MFIRQCYVKIFISFKNFFLMTFHQLLKNLVTRFHPLLVWNQTKLFYVMHFEA